MKKETKKKENNSQLKCCHSDIKNDWSLPKSGFDWSNLSLTKFFGLQFAKRLHMSA